MTDAVQVKILYDNTTTQVVTDQDLEKSDNICEPCEHCFLDGMQLKFRLQIAHVVLSFITLLFCLNKLMSII